MSDPIEDVETMSEHPHSIDPAHEERAEALVEGMSESGPEVTIVHFNGSDTISDFTHIKEIDAERQKLRVFHDEDETEWTDFHGATITEVKT